MRRSYRWILLFLLGPLAGCAANGRGGTLADVGPRGDASPAADGGTDGAVRDTGPGRPDTGRPVEDAGPLDSGPETDCVTNADCSDGVDCTEDLCGPDGACTHVPQDGDGDMVLALGCLGGTDCDDTNASIHPDAVEVCDGVDNDCSGMADDGTGMECVMGSGTRACTTTCGTTGSQDCTASCTLTACAAPEICNGCDDNANGSADEIFSCAAGSTTDCMTGCGLNGVRTCSNDCSTLSACSAGEICNGCDDDLDGTCDNGSECCLGATESCTVSGCTGSRFCGSGCTWGTCDLGTAPGNDACAGALPAILGSGAYPFATCAAGNDFTATCGSGAGSPDVVFRLEVPSTSDVVLEVTDATYDTVLALRSGPTCPGTEVQCDDDGGAIPLSRIAATLNAGTYYVVVDGFSTSEQGSGVLSVSMSGVGPGNDECANAVPIPLNVGRTVVRGTTSGATNSADSCSGASGDVWYRFTVPRREIVMIDSFRSGFDTHLGMRDGSCGAVTSSCVDDSCSSLESRIVRNLGPGEYFLVVDGFAGAAGDFTLTLEHLSVGNNNVPTELTAAGQSSWVGTTSGLGVVGACSDSLDAPENLFYWTQCPGAPGGNFAGDTCSTSTVLDTVLYVVSGASGAYLDCNDDDFSCLLNPTSSYIEATIPAGAGLFGYYVDGFGGEAGSYATAITRP